MATDGCYMSEILPPALFDATFFPFMHRKEVKDILKSPKINLFVGILKSNGGYMLLPFYLGFFCSLLFLSELVSRGSLYVFALLQR